MTWQEFKDWLDPFIWGFAIGYLWHPFWTAIDRIWQEAKIARKEWRQPPGDRNG